MSKEEIIKWAEETVAMDGAKFTPLSKNSQFEIAKLILELNGSEVVETNGKESSATEEVEMPPTDCELMDGIAAEGDEADESILLDEHEGIPTGADTVRPTFMRRSEFFHLHQYDAQAVYDEFLKWAADNPRDAVVMDFSTGEKNPGASFAYWLGEMVNVDEMVEAKR